MKSRKTFSGKTAPELTPEQKALQQQYFALPQGTGARKQFLNANPWLTKFWQDDNEFTDEERKALGFFQDKPDDTNGSGYGYSGYSGGSGGGDYTPFGLLGEATNLGGNVKRYKNIATKPYEQIDQELSQALNRLFAPRKGGRANVKLGASIS